MNMRFRAALSGGLVGFVLGIFVAGAAFSVFALSGQTPVAARRIEPAHPLVQVKTYTHRIVLAAIGRQDIDGAVATMGLPHLEQQRIREDLEEGRYRLLWLTLWDWDASTEKGDTISISSDTYRRLFTLHNRRTTIAVPEPKSGYLELRGEQSEDGNISISLLSGAQPLALPRMSLGQAIKVEIDTP